MADIPGLGWEAEGRDEIEGILLPSTSNGVRRRVVIESTDSENGHPEESEEWCIAVDVQNRKLAVVPATHDTHTYCLLAKLDDSDMAKLGLFIKESQIGPYDDKCIYCEECDAFYRGACREHPLFWVTDRNEKTLTEKTRAERTLPALFRLRQSSIPNAGKGVFANMDIPVGLVFGPYQGVKTDDPKKADVAGYAWEVRHRPKNLYIDGSDPEYANWMRYINSARHQEEQNLIAFQYNGSVYYRVFRPIDINKELLVWYGNKFGEALGICTTQTQPLKKSGGVPKGNNPFIL